MQIYPLQLLRTDKSCKLLSAHFHCWSYCHHQSLTGGMGVELTVSTNTAILQIQVPQHSQVTLELDEVAEKSPQQQL
jgi:hypothetical protein